MIWSPNVDDPDGAVTLSTQEGLTLRSSVLALARYDDAGGDVNYRDLTPLRWGPCEN